MAQKMVMCSTGKANRQNQVAYWHWQAKTESLS
jgi:hypothetical protein